MLSHAYDHNLFPAVGSGCQNHVEVPTSILSLSLLTCRLVVLPTSSYARLSGAFSNPLFDEGIFILFNTNSYQAASTHMAFEKQSRLVVAIKLSVEFKNLQSIDFFHYIVAHLRHPILQYVHLESSRVSTCSCFTRCRCFSHTIFDLEGYRYEKPIIAAHSPQLIESSRSGRRRQR